MTNNNGIEIFIFAGVFICVIIVLTIYKTIRVRNYVYEAKPRTEFMKIPMCKIDEWYAIKVYKAINKAFPNSVTLEDVKEIMKEEETI